MLGIAVGAVGMSVEDFDGLTPGEFSEIYRAYAETEEARFRNGWEIARFEALYSIAPHSRKRLKPQDICTFDWEKKARRTNPEDDRETVRRTREMLRGILSFSSRSEATPRNGQPFPGERYQDTASHRKPIQNRLPE